MPNHLPVPNIPKGVTESNDRLLAVKDDDSLSLLPYAEDQLAQDASIAANAEAIKALDALTDGGVEEAPVDGLQYARQDEGWVEVAGSDFDGEHVLIGDPAAPPDGLDAGQLLWDGVEGSSGGGGDAGPHDHDYLPLTGGTLTGDLQVDGKIRTSNGSEAAPSLAFTSQPDMGLWRRSATDLAFSVSGHRVMGLAMTSGYEGVYAFENLFAKKDLKVDGTLKLPNCRDQSDAISVAPNVYLTQSGNLRFTTFEVAPKVFSIADGIDTADILNRAETATMPALDDEGVATTDADVDSITVNEVVTALLAKVKELSAEIEELKGA